MPEKHEEICRTVPPFTLPLTTVSSSYIGRSVGPLSRSMPAANARESAPIRIHFSASFFRFLFPLPFSASFFRLFFSC